VCSSSSSSAGSTSARQVCLQTFCAKPVPTMFSVPSENARAEPRFNGCSVLLLLLLLPLLLLLLVLLLLLLLLLLQ